MSMKWTMRKKSSSDDSDAKEISELKSDINSLKNQLIEEKDTLKKELSSVSEERKRVEKEKQELQSEMKEMENLRKEIKLLQSQKATLEKDKKSITDQKEKLRKELWKYQSEKVEIEKLKKDFEKQQSDFIKDKESFNKDYSSYISSKESTDASLSQLVEKNSELTVKLSELEGRLSEIISKNKAPTEDNDVDAKGENSIKDEPSIPESNLVSETNESKSQAAKKKTVKAAQKDTENADIKEKADEKWESPVSVISPPKDNDEEIQSSTSKLMRQVSPGKNKEAERSGEPIPFTHRELLVFKKAQLKIICKEYGIPYDEKETKNIIIEKILEQKKAL